jgi:hypothetical protein
MLIPQPPIEMLVDKTAELYITGFLAVIAVCGVLYSLVHWSRSGRPVVLLLFLAGGAMMVFEPMVDTVGGCWFAANSYVAFEAYGRPMPVWLCLAYFFYFGIASATIWMSLRRGMTRMQIWMAFCLAMLGDLVFESVLLVFDPYVYYGHQPLLLGNGFAAWWMPVNALIPVVLGAVVYRFDEHFRGWRSLLIVPVGLTTSAAANASIGWPSWLVVNTPLPWTLTQMGGLLTFILAFAFVHTLCSFVAKDARSGLRATAAQPAC